MYNDTLITITTCLRHSFSTSVSVSTTATIVSRMPGDLSALDVLELRAICDRVTETTANRAALADRALGKSSGVGVFDGVEEFGNPVMVNKL